MVCKHNRIKSVNCELFCIDCGERLPPDYFRRNTAANSAPDDEPEAEPAAPVKAAETPKKPGRKPAKKGTK